MAPTPPVSRREEHEHRAVSETPQKAECFKTNKQKVLPVDLKASVPAKFSSPEINPKENVLVHEATKVVSKDDIPVGEDLVARAGKDVDVYRAPDVAVEASLPDPDEKASAVDLKASVPANFSVPEINPKVNVLPHGAPKVASEADIPVDESSAVKDKSLIHERAAIQAKVTVNPGTENVKTNADKERMLKIILSRNNDFQHYYIHNEPKGCVRCEQVQQLLDHEKHPETNACHECQLINGIRVFHKRVCPLTAAGTDCLFCRAIKEHESDDGTQDCANPPSDHKSQQNDRISHVLTQISRGGLLKKGTQFIEGVHYELEEDLGEGGFGVVKGVKLLEPGKKILSLDGQTIELAAKIANMDDYEIQILKQLVNCPYIAQHYFVVDSNNEVWKKNYRKKKKELKRFKQILFMKRADKSLEQHKNGLKDRVLPLQEAVIFFRQIVLAEAYAQSSGIFHNDIKPSNVLIFCNGDKEKTANLCDFEFAERCGFPRARSGGTKYYEPPKVKTSSSKDIYALGLLFLELTIARASLPPERSKWHEFKGELVKELERKNKRLGALIKGCLEQRISIGYLRDELDEIGDVEGWWSNAL